MKKFYVKPDSFVVKLNVSGRIAEDALPVNNSKTVPSHEIEAKETGFGGDEWFSSGIEDYSEKWFKE